MTRLTTRRRRVWPATPQERSLATMSLVDSVGTGLFIATVPVFLIAHQHLDASKVGWALSGAGFALLVITIPAGLLTDMLPLRGLYGIGSLLQAAASVFLATSPPLAGATVALVAASLGAGIVAPPRSVIVARAAPADDLVRVRAYNRAVFQVGMAIGSGAAVLIIWADRTEWFAVGFVLNALTFVANTVVVRFVRLHGGAAERTPPSARPGGRLVAFRDGPFLLAAGTNALLCVCGVLADPVLAIYVAVRSDGLTFLIPMLLTLNMVLTVLLQVPLSRGCVGADGVRRGQRKAGVAVLVGCGVFALTTLGGHTGLIIAGLFLGMALLAVAEIFVSAASWEASFRLAPHHLQGQYFSTFNLGPGLAMAFGPALLTPMVDRKSVV